MLIFLSSFLINVLVGNQRNLSTSRDIKTVEQLMVGPKHRRIPKKLTLDKNLISERKADKINDKGNRYKSWWDPWGRERGGETIQQIRKPGPGQLKIKHLRMPNVKSVKVLDGGLHDWLSNFGIVSKSSNRKLSILKYKRTSNHRYLAYMEARLIKLSQEKNSKLYWITATHFMQHSNLLFIWALRSVELNWHRKWTEVKILELWHKYKMFMIEANGHIKVSRVWIQSPAKKERGLSVPAIEYRIASAAMTKLLEIWVTPDFAIWQHAYISDKGCGTAWRFFFKWLYHAPNLLEFDLKNFFPSINHTALRKILRTKGISNFNAMWMICLIRAELTLPTSLEIPDIATGAPTIRKRNIFELLLHKNEPEFRHNKKRGVPMGLALAPLLAVLVIQDALEKADFLKEVGAQIVMYADDGLIAWWNPNLSYTDVMNLFENALKPYDVEVNMEKSKLLKWNNKWKHKIKFLGMILDPWTDIWSSDTRKGSKLALNLTVLKIIQPNGKWIDNYLVLNMAKNSRYHPLFTWVKIPVIAENSPYKDLQKVMPLKKFLMNHSWMKFMNHSIKLFKYNFLKHANQKIKDNNNQFFRPYKALHKLVIGGQQLMFFMLVDRKEVINDMFKLGTPKLFAASLNWRNVINSRYLGDIMARMYIGRWDVDVEQNFGLNWTKDSYMEKLTFKERNWIKSLWIEGLEMSVFTSTTVSWILLAQTLRLISRLHRGEYVGPKILNCLPGKFEDKLLKTVHNKKIMEKKTTKALDRKIHFFNQEWLSKGKEKITQYFNELLKEEMTPPPIQNDGTEKNPTWGSWMSSYKNYVLEILLDDIKTLLQPKKASRKHTRNRIKVNAVSWLKALGLDRRGKPLKFDRKKSCWILENLIKLQSEFDTENLVDIQKEIDEDIFGYEDFFPNPGETRGTNAIPVELEKQYRLLKREGLLETD